MPPVLILSKSLSVPTQRPPHHPLVGIRHYRGPADAHRWLQIQQVALGRIGRGRCWTEADFRRQWLERPWWRPDRLLIAQDRRRSAEAVGVVGHRPGVGESCQTARLLWLAVRPRWQRQGIGRLLVESLERQCFADGMRRLELETLAGWDAAIAFYRALGYSEEG